MNNKQSKLSKILKIIIVNFILFVIFFHIADFVSALILYNREFLQKDYQNNILFLYLKQYKNNHKYSLNFDSEEAYDTIIDLYYSEKDDEHIEFRPIENKNADKSIIIFGCSYAYGLMLSNEETFSYLLGRSLQNYRIYNNSSPGWSTSHMLYQLENKVFNKNIPNVKYVIYVFMDDHIVRDINSPYSGLPPYYKAISNNLYLQKHSLKNMNFPLKNMFAFNEHLKFHGEKKCDKFKGELTKKIIEKSKRNVEKEFGSGTKFIIFRYDNGEKEPYNQIFNELKKEDFDVVSLKDLSDTDYLTPKYQLSKTDLHPNALAWKEITPLFVKYLQDRGYLKD